jgi:hypothetical protein
MFRRKIELTLLSTLSAGLAVFSFASAIITVAARLDYLRDFPDQIYADRYLAWPALFWSCLAILSVAAIARAGGKFIRIAGTACLVVLPIMLSATQRSGAIWGALVYREAQQTAAQVRSGIYDRSHFPGVNFSAEEELQQIAMLRTHRIAMFAEPSWQRIGTAWTGSLEQDVRIEVNASWVGAIDDAAAGERAGHVEGWFTRGIAHAQRLGKIALLDRNGVIAGFAEYSFVNPTADALMLHLPRKRGFDGYVRRFEAGETYTLALLDFEHNRGVRLIRVTANPEPAVPQATAAGSESVSLMPSRVGHQFE